MTGGPTVPRLLSAGSRTDAVAVQLGVDIGGTFTDVALEDGDRRWSIKVPTTHAAPEAGVLDAIDRALALAGRSLTDVSLLVHGTTLATNALIERKGARTALLTTRGFRDVLEMGNEGRFDQYDLRVERPVPLVPRYLRFVASERLRADGSVDTPLDEAAVVAAAQLMRMHAVEAVAVTFLHAYADGAHEARAGAILSEILGDVPISLSHQVSPEIREFERTSTTCANAYLQPVMSGYLCQLEQRLQARGMAGPMLMILSSGSLTTVETAARFPIRLLESGPAGGAIFACDIARRLGLDRVLSFDVGGTTAKFCLIDDGEARHAQAFEVGRTYRFKKGSGLPMRVPVIDLVEIGAGGGSIARLDSVGRIAVGPDSAGSEPGPACYGRSGRDATVTDCDLAQGKLDPAAFAGGTMPLDPEAAEDAIGRALAGTGLAIDTGAFAVTETMTETMAAAARVHAAEIGTELSGRTLIAFGGGAPLQAVRFADKLGIDEIVVPVGAGVGSAIGFLRAPVAYEAAQTALLRLPGGDVGRVRATLARLEQQARAVVSTIDGGADLLVTRTAYMRYLGQGHEIEVAFDGDPDDAVFAAGLQAGFDAAYRRIYGRSMGGRPIEATTWVVRAQRQQDAIEPAFVSLERSAAVPTGSRQVYNGHVGFWEGWPEFDRDQLAPGAWAPGPAIISEAETTTVVPHGFSFSIDASRFIRITRDVAQ